MFHDKVTDIFQQLKKRNEKGKKTTSIGVVWKFLKDDIMGRKMS